MVAGSVTITVNLVTMLFQLRPASSGYISSNIDTVPQHHYHCGGTDTDQHESSCSMALALQPLAEPQRAASAFLLRSIVFWSPQGLTRKGVRALLLPKGVGVLDHVNDAAQEGQGRRGACVVCGGGGRGVDQRQVSNT